MKPITPHPIVYTVMTAFFLTQLLIGAENYKGFPRGSSLISPQELKQRIDAKDSDLVILAVAKSGDFKRGHIPGAINIWRPDYEAKPTKHHPFTGMLLSHSDFQTFARSLGINNDSHVVIYDHKYDAARIWWAFYLYGKKDCRILDGGFQGWKAEGYETGKGAYHADQTEGTFSSRSTSESWTADMHDVQESDYNPSVQLWDTREPAEWLGTKLKRGAFRKGRIPWAKFLHWSEFKHRVSTEEKHPTAFKSADQIKAVIARHNMDPNKEQIFYCQSGVRTTTAIFALYLSGWNPSTLRNYDGSWIEWTYYKTNPIASGKPVKETRTAKK